MKILMVEDHELFARNAASAFLTHHDVVVESSINDAKGCFHSSDFDVLLVDYDLPDGKGDEFVRWVREAGSVVRIIAISSHEYGNEMLEAAGANATCSKMEFGRIGG